MSNRRDAPTFAITLSIHMADGVTRRCYIALDGQWMALLNVRLLVVDVQYPFSFVYKCEGLKTSSRGRPRWFKNEVIIMNIKNNK